jgi:hypothetical protein
MPPSREGHTITFLPQHNVILLFGGISNMRMNDLYFYEISKNNKKNGLFDILMADYETSTFFKYLERNKQLESSPDYWKGASEQMLPHSFLRR